MAGGLFLVPEDYEMASSRIKHRADGTAVTHVQILKRGFRPLTATFERKSEARAWVQQVETRMRERRFLTAFKAWWMASSPMQVSHMRLCRVGRSRRICRLRLKCACSTANDDSWLGACP